MLTLLLIIYVHLLLLRLLRDELLVLLLFRLVIAVIFLQLLVRAILLWLRIGTFLVEHGTRLNGVIHNFKDLLRRVSVVRGAHNNANLRKSYRHRSARGCWRRAA